MALITVDDSAVEAHLTHQAAQIAELQALVTAQDQQLAELTARLDELKPPAPSPSPALAALWVPLMYQSVERRASTLDRAQQAGFSALLCSTYWDGAYYPSSVLRPREDRLGPMVQESGERGLTVYPAIHCGYYYQDWPDCDVRAAHPTAPAWLDFELATARSNLADVVTELVSLYPSIPGVCIDHCRWWIGEPSYGVVGVASRWITYAAAAMSKALRAAGKSPTLAVNGDPAYALRVRGQDWLGWGEWADRFWVMCYQPDRWVDTMHAQWRGLEDRIVALLTAGEFVDHPTAARPTADVVAQVEHLLSLSPAVEGIGLFSAEFLSADLANELARVVEELG